MLSTLVAQFHEFELASGYAERVISGHHYWPLIRVHVFQALSQEQGYLSALHHRPKGQYWRRLREKHPDPQTLLRCYNAQRLGSADILLMNHSRSQYVGGVPQNPYSDALFRDLPWSHWDLRFSEEGHHVAANFERVFYLDALYNAAYRGAALRFRFHNVRASLRQEAQGLAEALSKHFGTRVASANVDKLLWNSFRIQHGFGAICDWLLDRIKPRIIVNVVHYSYANLVMTSRAKRRGILVAELQHGTITREHIGYNVPSAIGVNTRPDQLLLFGDFWRDEASGLGLRPEHMPAIGFAHLEAQRPHARHLTQYPAAASTPAASAPTTNTVTLGAPVARKELLVLSQSSIGVRLAELVAQCAPALAARGFKVVYRLHPNEVHGWERRMPQLRHSSIEVCTGNTPLYTALERAHVQLGVYSTALFEGLAFNVKTLVARLPGSEGMARLVQSGNASYVADSSELLHTLDALNLDARSACAIDRKAVEQLFVPNAVANFRAFLDQELSPRWVHSTGPRPTQTAA